MTRRIRWVCTLWLVARMAVAATPDTGISADRFVPAVGRNGLLGVEASATPPPGALWFAATLSYAAHPLRIRNTLSGATITEPVSGVLVFDVQAEVGLTRRISVGLGVPAALYGRGTRLRDLGVSDEQPLGFPVLGDVRMRFKWNFVHGWRGLGLAGVALATFPAGGERTFAATATPTFEPRLVLDYRAHAFASVIVDIGVRVAGPRQLFETRFGTEAHLGGGLRLTPFERLRSAPHLTLEVESWIGASQGSRPVEGRLSLGVKLGRGVLLVAGGGIGFNRDAASPAWRALLLLRWAPRAP